jgi:conjugative transfer region protein (TIGR03748 family)
MFKACFLAVVVLMPLPSPAAAPLHSGYALITEPFIPADLEQTVYAHIRGRSLLQGLLEILVGTGYRLADLRAADPDIKRLYGQPYPEQQRQIGPLELGSVLERLAGPAWQLVVDPVNRRVSFELRGPYRPGAVAPLASPHAQEGAP